MKIAKKAQLSWFVVMGLVFLVILAIVSWLAYSTQFIKKPSQTLSAEEIISEAHAYLKSCELELTEEAFILIGNKGAEQEGLPSLEEISKETAKYIDEKLARNCRAETVTKKEVTSELPNTKITFNDKETIIETDWTVTLTLENNTKHNIDVIKFSLPLRMKKVHEAVTKDLETSGTDLNFVNSLDNMDVKKIKYENHILNIVVDHKSYINNKPYKFFYVENI